MTLGALRLSSVDWRASPGRCDCDRLALSVVQEAGRRRAPQAGLRVYQVALPTIREAAQWWLRCSVTKAARQSVQPASAGGSTSQRRRFNQPAQEVQPASAGGRKGTTQRQRQQQRLGRRLKMKQERVRGGAVYVCRTCEGTSRVNAFPRGSAVSRVRLGCPHTSCVLGRCKHLSRPRQGLATGAPGASTESHKCMRPGRCEVVRWRTRWARLGGGAGSLDSLPFSGQAVRGRWRPRERERATRRGDAGKVGC